MSFPHSPPFRCINNKINESLSIQNIVHRGCLSWPMTWNRLNNCWLDDRSWPMTTFSWPMLADVNRCWPILTCIGRYRLVLTESIDDDWDHSQEKMLTVKQLGRQTAKLSLDRCHWWRKSEKLTDYGDAPETLCHHPPPYWRCDSNRLIVERDPHAFVNAWYVKKIVVWNSSRKESTEHCAGQRQ